ncbi:hypothetical protein ANCCEY_09218 [Ancylostoma ceylanicum]|uniref:EF-hand domain-containing protein n=1 Tax=Ancylostoma ceylanicum TaxID=53326 RepID=A0A0D6LI69_9BILA|nr:hypothetical protein ANCCEY_09218 [Ancylostoma ceylanicum]
MRVFSHIKEHLDGKVDPTANMTPEQLQFHYFNMHDLDKNGKLDGVELIKAITHFHAAVNCIFEAMQLVISFTKLCETLNNLELVIRANKGVDRFDLLQVVMHTNLHIYVSKLFTENPGPQHQNTNQPPPLPSEIELESMIDSILR